MADAGQVERVFIGGGGGAALHAAADWLVDGLGAGAEALGGALVVVPGGRAQRRLMELLAERSAGRALLPPTVVTLGGLVDRLMPGDVKVASGLESLLAWSSVLREAEGGLLSDIVPSAPGRDDWPGWWSLGEQVMGAADELGAQLLGLGDVAERSPGPGDAARWAALSGLSGRYAAALAERGLVDRHTARLDAIERGACGWPGVVVLVATADLQPLQTRALGCVDSPVYALIAAGEDDAEGFDAYGGLIESYWVERPIAIDDDWIVVVDRPGDQALAVVEAVRGWSGAGPTSADDITVGLGDASLSGPVARALGLAGLPVRSAVGRQVAGARPVLLLKALGEFANGLRFDKLAQLLRHPDAEQAVSERSGGPTRPWLTLLDRYATDHLAARPVSGWLGDAEQVSAMDAVYRAALSLLPEGVASGGALRPLGEWAGPIGASLAEVYGGRRLMRYGDEDRALVAALEALGEVLGAIGSVEGSAAPYCTYAQAVSLVVSRLSGRTIPEPGGEPAIELVGYLELLLDDAPLLVIAGMNEQHVPEPPRTSPLLPEGARRALGLAGDGRRLARDGYALSSMLAWREGAKLITGKRSVDGDPLLPSRLLLRADDQTLVRRVSGFVAEGDGPGARAPLLLTPGRVDRFLIPRPVLPPEPITKLRVTAFRDYLACPYRFYLKHVLGLEALDDRAMEMSAGGFGTLAHDALRVLALDDLAGVDDVDTIAGRLEMSLDRVFASAYGGRPPVAAQVQAEQLRYRLVSFAKHHAAMVSQGWSIAHHEKRLSAEVRVDGEPFTITGQIDRIDRHDELGWRLIDYKTSDTAKKPSQTHLQNVDGAKQWVDLQLPLYLDLSAGLGVPGSAELGYINLPKKRGDSGYTPAGWDADALAGARERRDFVIRKVREGVFWPPRETPGFDDGLSGLCADGVADRAALIAASGGGA